MTINSVCVYCGSSNRVDPLYKETARVVGIALAENKKHLIYGGGHVGLMGIIADATLAAGGSVTGIIPEHIRSHEVQHLGLSELIVVETMHVRKSMMAEKADAFVALPGGFGTLDEVFEILTWKQLGLHTKPIVFYNAHNFWAPAIALLEHVIETRFAPEKNREYYQIVDSVPALLAALEAPTPAPQSIEDKWGQ